MKWQNHLKHIIHSESHQDKLVSIVIHNTFYIVQGKSGVSAALKKGRSDQDVGGDERGGASCAQAPEARKGGFSPKNTKKSGVFKKKGGARLKRHIWLRLFVIHIVLWYFQYQSKNGFVILILTDSNLHFGVKPLTYCTRVVLFGRKRN